MIATVNISLLGNLSNDLSKTSHTEQISVESIRYMTTVEFDHLKRLFSAKWGECIFV